MDEGHRSTAEEENPSEEARSSTLRKERNFLITKRVRVLYSPTTVSPLPGFNKSRVHVHGFNTVAKSILPGWLLYISKAVAVIKLLLGASGTPIDMGGHRTPT